MITMNTKMSVGTRTEQAIKMLKQGYEIGIVATVCALPYRYVVSLIG
jgi:hypothetical protein